VLRGAYGIFYEPVYAGVSSVPNQSPPFIEGIALSDPHSFSDPFNVANGGTDAFPYTYSQSNPVFPATTFEAYADSPNFTTPYVQEFNLNLQHQFGSTIVVQAGYVGKVGTHLTGLHDMNQAIYGPGATVANEQQRRPI